MNAQDVLKYGNRTVLHTIDNLPEDDWLAPDVCGWWSTKEIIAHLASFEHILVELLRLALGGEIGPYAVAWLENGQTFNDVQVPDRAHMTPGETLAEYLATQETAREMAAEVPLARLREPGILPAYGMEYDLEDIIAYTFYGHKREHCAQIAIFRDKIGR